ncbi:hypothetical protein GQ53DRAFT_747126 [Thozetella sp. PMI_491]|nr:hypothetical protein GQ53DRAFT_747126 [Thozetella sp. PMI_491]
MFPRTRLRGFIDQPVSVQRFTLSSLRLLILSHGRSPGAISVLLSHRRTGASLLIGLEEKPLLTRNMQPPDTPHFPTDTSAVSCLLLAGGSILFAPPLFSPLSPFPALTHI